MPSARMRDARQELRKLRRQSVGMRDLAALEVWNKLTVHIVTLRLLVIRHRQQQRPGVRWAKRPAVVLLSITVDH